MADPRDDRVTAAYRELPDEGPSPALDAALRAAARRAVGSRPGAARRWQVPVSIAAVLALAIGVSLQVDREKPMIVDGTPVSTGNAEYPVSAPASEAEERVTPAKPMSAPPEKKVNAAPPAAPSGSSSVPAAPREAMPAASREAMPAAPAVLLKESVPARAAQSFPAPEAKRFAPDPPRAESPALPASPAASVASPTQGSGAISDSAPSTLKSAPPPAAAPPVSADAAEPARAAPRAVGRAKSEAIRDAATVEKAMVGAVESAERRLERIAGLRARSLHDEADRALAEFRREYPGYRISEEWLRKVERR